MNDSRRDTGPETLRIDGTTLSDLEVLEGRGGPGLLQLLDRTQTRAGAVALSRRLSAPMVRARDIRAVQDALDALAGFAGIVVLEDRLLRAAESYLRSSIVLGSGNRLRAMVQEIWLRLRYRDVYREMTEGLEAIRGLRRTLARVAEALGSPGIPALLRDLGARLGRVALRIERAFRVRSPLAADRELRGPCRDEIVDALAAIADLDALQTMALAGRDAGWCRPELLEPGEFHLEVSGAVHPFLPEATPNPVRLTGGEPLVFLTGPNMAGKTTYLRTVGLLVLLAQTGMRVPARSMRLSPVEAVLTSLNPVDSLRRGVSFFYAEVLRVQEAARLLAEGCPSLILFDEAFKGTNVRDALDASTEVIRGFARSRRSGSIFSSHLTELAGRLGDAPVRFSRFEGEIRDGEPRFTFRLEAGVSETRFGMLLLEQARVPELIRRIGA